MEGSSMVVVYFEIHLLTPSDEGIEVLEKEIALPVLPRRGERIEIIRLKKSDEGWHWQVKAWTFRVHDVVHTIQVEAPVEIAVKMSLDREDPHNFGPQSESETERQLVQCLVDVYKWNVG
jgi:hypothetical protein